MGGGVGGGGGQKGVGRSGSSLPGTGVDGLCLYRTIQWVDCSVRHGGHIM